VRPVRREALVAVVAIAAGGGATVLVATGGSDGGPPASGSRTSHWATLSSAGLERSEVAAARIGRGIYVVGGFEQRSGATTRAVERYDIRRDRWERVRSMPIGVNHAAAVAYHGRLYVHGGYRARRNLSSTTARLYRYDPARDHWSRLPSSPVPRAAHALATVDGKLYAAGGANATGSLRSLDVYDFVRRRWRSGPDFPGPARDHTTGAASGGLFYVLAGRNHQHNFRSVDRYDPRTGRWRALPMMRQARGGIASVRLRDGRIVVFGGEQLGSGGRHDPPGRDLRAGSASLAASPRDAHSPPRFGRGSAREPRLRARGRAEARLPLLQRARVPRRHASLSLIRHHGVGGPCSR
jgi:N-acetylneuraminic acid mutarotase